MNDILFSSWGGRIIDNRGKNPEAWESLDQIELPDDFKKDQRIKAFVGWGGIILRSTEVDLLDMIRTYTEAVYDHAKACDKCNYCKTGWAEHLEVFQDIYNGEATDEDLEFLESSAEAIVDAGKCTIGKAGPTPLLQALKYFPDEFQKALKGEKPSKSCTYYSKMTAPCMDACPIHLDVPKYVELIKDAKFEESLNVIRDRLPIAGCVGRMCVRPCEDHCQRANVDEPIAIRSLKRFVADNELSKNYKPEYQITPSENTGKVAVVGAGPAGMTCAYHLALNGHQVTVFEILPVAGGMMAVGIPKYSLPPDILAKEIEAIEKIGVAVKAGVSYGKDITLDSLKEEGFNAVFLGMGLHGSRRLGVEGEDLEGVIPGIQFLRDVALDRGVKLVDKVIVVGGGNVAVDVARTAKRLGAGDVTMVCLESLDEMPAWKHEIEGAIKEEIDIINSFGPNRITGEDGKVTGVEFKHCTRVFDENSHFNPQYDEANLQTLPSGTVIVAIGQSMELTCTKGEEMPISTSGEFQTDPITFQTKREWVFVGGDAVYGPESVVEAAASGRKAAMGIDRFINNLPIEPDNDDHFDRLFKSVRPYDPNEEISKKIEILDRKKPPMLSPEKRISNFDEIEQVFSTPNAVAEAERCLRCYRVMTVAV